MTHHKPNGFSLAELSIVLVIIGLLVGGISGGQKLILQSKIHAQISELKKYDVAIQSFNLAYDALPGDMIDASN